MLDGLDNVLVNRIPTDVRVRTHRIAFALTGSDLRARLMPESRESSEVPNLWNVSVFAAESPVWVARVSLNRTDGDDLRIT